jgi:hypothetical protein
MSNNGVRILIERREGNRYYWTLTAYGDEHYCKHSEASPARAAEQVETHLMQIELSRHYKQRANRNMESTK